MYNVHQQVVLVLQQVNKQCVVQLESVGSVLYIYFLDLFWFSLPAS